VKNHLLSEYGEVKSQFAEKYPESDVTYAWRLWKKALRERAAAEEAEENS
jgi:hypothetical protein